MFGLSTQLAITLGANILSGALILAGGFFVLAQNVRGKRHWLFFFLTMSTLAYTVFFIIAGAQTDVHAAYFWWSLNLVDVFITMSVVHFIFAVIERDREWRPFIILTYVVGLIIFAASLIHPSLFLPAVVPKMYFPFYLEAGPLYVAMLVHFLVFPLIAFGALIVQFFKSTGVTRQRYEYFVLMLVIGYAIGCMNFFLVFNIPVDPVFGAFLGFYFIPVAYGIFATNLLDIRLVVQRAFYYGIAIAAIAAFLAALILLNDLLVESIPYVRFWTIPVAVAVVAVLFGRIGWNITKESDRLKYEFITIATHKLRTPLTRIRWEIPALLEKAASLPEVREGLVRIDIANNRLIELTNVLMESAHTEDTTYTYQRAPIDLRLAIQNAVARFDGQIKEKKLFVVVEALPDSIKPVGDTGRIASVVDILIENAVIYTPAGGSIHISLKHEGRAVKLSVSDTGIGISEGDATRIFSGFYRADSAKKADTEGVGIGLTVAKSIVEKHGGRIGVTSLGEGKGSVFWFTLPLA